MKRKKIAIGVLLLLISPLFWWPMKMRQDNQLFAEAVQTDKELVVMTVQHQCYWQGSPLKFLFSVLILGYSPSYLVNKYQLWRVTNDGRQQLETFYSPNPSLWVSNGNLYLITASKGSGKLLFHLLEDGKFSAIANSLNDQLNSAIAVEVEQSNAVKQGGARVKKFRKDGSKRANLICLLPPEITSQFRSQSEPNNTR